MIGFKKWYELYIAILNEKTTIKLIKSLVTKLFLTKPVSFRIRKNTIGKINWIIVKPIKNTVVLLIVLSLKKPFNVKSLKKRGERYFFKVSVKILGTFAIVAA